MCKRLCAAWTGGAPENPLHFDRLCAPVRLFVGPRGLLGMDHNAFGNNVLRMLRLWQAGGIRSLV